MKLNLPFKLYTYIYPGCLQNNNKNVVSSLYMSGKSAIILQNNEASTHQLSIKQKGKMRLVGLGQILDKLY